MTSFVPKHMLSLEAQLKKLFPLPKDYALRDADSARTVLQNLRTGAFDFYTMSISDFQLSYQMSALCSDDEYACLLSAFKKRLTVQLFETGWVYHQQNPDDARATALFLAACKWMRQRHPDIYGKTLPARAGMPWSEVYMRSVDILKGEHLSIEEFCRKFDIMQRSPFYDRLFLTYLSRCDKEGLKENETALAKLILKADIEFVRPALGNYTANFSFDEMDPLLMQAIVERLNTEPENVTLGLSPNMLQRIRQKQFDGILADYTQHNDSKLNVYRPVVGKLKDIRALDSGFFVLDFGTHILLDNMDWKLHAYVYSPELFRQLLEQWPKGEEGYWPAVSDEQIVSAHDIVLGLRKGRAVKVSFDGFDMLYARDLLSNPRNL